MNPIHDPALLNRRDTLRWSFGLSLGSVVGGLAACGGGGADPAPAPVTADTLPEAPVLTPAGGRLDLELIAQYTQQTRPLVVREDGTASVPPVYPGPAKAVQTALRSFNGAYLAPTLRVNAGDTLRILLNNQLPPSVPDQSPMRDLNHQNSTNLHFHGLHVDPKEIRPGVYGDYVVDSADAGVLPGTARQHEIHIPADHPSGIYWYHPHLHGATNTQVVSGMFGAILVQNPAEDFAAPGELRERVIFVHKLALNQEGRTDSFNDSTASRASDFVLNGAHQPTLVMRPGEVQIWHFLNVASFYPFNPVLDGHTMQAFARDANVFDRVFAPVDASTAPLLLADGQVDAPHWPGNALYPGGRLSVLVQASSEPGSYYLRSVRAPSNQYDEEIVARVVVEGEPTAMTMPSADRLPVYDDHRPIGDEELARHGGKQRDLVLGVLSKDSELLARPIPEGEQWFNPAGGPVFATGAFGPVLAMAPYQSSLTPTQTVALDSVEEWTIHNLDAYPHPFHIHVNDMYVVRINDEPVTPFWCDTLPIPPRGSFTFRMRFADFSGKFVWHCHALNHEDMGMMQLVDVVG